MKLILPVRDNIELRLLQESDARPLFDAVRKNADHLRKWFAWVDDDKSSDDTLSYIKDAQQRYEQKKCVELLIWTGESLIGSVILSGINAEYKKASVAYWIDKEFEGRGIITDALKAVIAYAFTDLKLNRLEITCGVGNERSSALPKKFGFAFEGISRQAEWIYGRPIDLEVYSLLAKEWNK